MQLSVYFILPIVITSQEFHNSVYFLCQGVLGMKVKQIKNEENNKNLSILFVTSSGKNIVKFPDFVLLVPFVNVLSSIWIMYNMFIYQLTVFLRIIRTSI